jgi:peptidoglycan/xylan/chitin deacetylase (PgdA/CDA1 family)
VSLDRLLSALWGNQRLTVLAYHRVIDFSYPEFDQHTAGVVSPAAFELQMSYIAKHFNVISLETLIDHIEVGAALPPYPLLITFDDGYLDNFTYAYPILKMYQLPAVIFLVTGYMTAPEMPWWDACAYLCHHTPKRHISLPGMGSYSLTTPARRFATREALIQILRPLPQLQRRRLLIEFEIQFGVTFPQAPSNLFMTWSQVRELVAKGISCQPHTITHVILTQESVQEMHHQVIGSCEIIAQETGQLPQAFAYPNGTSADYSKAVQKVLANVGCQVAFTMEPGPVHLGDLYARRYAIPRVYLTSWDTLSTLKLKLVNPRALLTREKAYRATLSDGI